MQVLVVRRKDLNRLLAVVRGNNSRCVAGWLQSEGVACLSDFLLLATKQESSELLACEAVGDGIRLLDWIANFDGPAMSIVDRVTHVGFDTDYCQSIQQH